MPDAKKRIVVDGVEFGHVVQFHHVLKAAASSLQPPRLVVALLAVATLIGFGRLWDGFVEPKAHPEGVLAGAWTAADDLRARDLMTEVVALNDLGKTTEDIAVADADTALSWIDDAYRRRSAADPDAIDLAVLAEDREEIAALAPLGPYTAMQRSIGDCVTRMVRGVVELRPGAVYEATGDLFIGVPRGVWRESKWFSVFFGFVALVVIAIGGGAVSRMAACELAGLERLRVREALDFSIGNAGRLVFTLVLPLLLAGAVTVSLLLFGLLMTPWLDLLGGVFYGLALLFGFVLTILLVGYILGFPLLIPAVACENCDAPDAQQRAYAYLLNRPLHFVGYLIVGLIGLALGYVVVAFFATTMLNLTAMLVGSLSRNTAMLGAGDFSIFDLGLRESGQVHGNWHSGFAASAISFWQTLVIDLVVAWLFAYFFSCATVIYLLMRRVCDGQDIEEIWRPGLTPGTLVPLPRTQVVSEPTDATPRSDATDATDA